MTSDDRLRQPQLAAHLPYFILEELTQRLDQCELHVRLEPAHVVVRLDRHRRPAMRRRRLDHIRIERSLHQELRVVPCRRGRVLEHIDERVADAPPLLLRILDPGERREKALGGVDGDQLDAETVSYTHLTLPTIYSV